MALRPDANGTARQVHATTEAEPPVALIQEMLQRLHAANVRFCHWKSNRGLPNALAGGEDLDILADRSTAGEFTSILSKLGFKQIRSGPDREFPGIEDHIGFDIPSGRIVHLQLHYRLILGEPLIKNFLFPIESTMLDRLDSSNGMSIPIPAAELAVFTLRILIKFKNYHIFKPTVADRLRKEAREEFAFLRLSENREQASLLISEFFPGFDPELFRTCLCALEGDASIFEILRLRREALEILRNYRRRTRFDTLRSLVERRIFLSHWQRTRGRIPKRTPASGGLLVAIIGPDGSGKSTAIAALDAWLKPFLNITLGHMGKPPKALKSRFVDRLVSIGERLTKASSPPARTSPRHEIAGGPGLQSLYAWQLACLAQDRKRESDRLSRAVEDGEIVLCDRYPMPGLHSMEACHGHRLQKARSGRAKSWIRMEKEFHDSIERPTLVVGLRVPSEMASQRQPGDGSDFVSFRAEEFASYIDAHRGEIVRIDAAEELAVVSNQLRQIVWQAL